MKFITLVTLLLSVGCVLDFEDLGPYPQGPFDAGPQGMDAFTFDAGPDMDSGPEFDSGTDSGPPFDGGTDSGPPSFDGGSDAGPHDDAGESALCMILDCAGDNLPGMTRMRTDRCVDDRCVCGDTGRSCAGIDVLCVSGACVHVPPDCSHCNPQLSDSCSGSGFCYCGGGPECGGFTTACISGTCF